MRKIRRIVIHCALTKKSMNTDIETIHYWHKDRGFGLVGYHKYIRFSGTVEQGRPDWLIGAHAAGYNGDSLSICLEGGLSEDNKPENNFNAEQFITLRAELLKWQSIYGPLEIVGHYELDSDKDCPCFPVKAWLEGNII